MAVKAGREKANLKTGKIEPVSITFLSSKKDDLGLKNGVLSTKITAFDDLLGQYSIFGQVRPGSAGHVCISYFCIIS